MLLLVGCGDIPCEEGFNIFVNGLCVRPNEFSISTEMLKKTINITQEGFNREYRDNPVDLETLFLENKISVQYVIYIKEHVLGLTDGETVNEAGEHVPTSVTIIAWSCMHRYFTLAHELLNVIAIHHLKDIECDHLCYKLFYEWAVENNMPEDSVVEDYLYDNIELLCKEN